MALSMSRQTGHRGSLDRRSRARALTAPARVHLMQGPVEEHAQRHQQIQDPQADDGRHQPRPLDHDPGQDGPEGDAGLGQGGERPKDPPQQLGWGVLLDDVSRYNNRAGRKGRSGSGPVIGC